MRPVTVRRAASYLCAQALRALFACWLLAGLPMTPSAQAASPADQLRARHAELQARLADNPYRRPLYLESSESSGRVRGEVYVRLDHPFATVAALARPAAWCDVLILHLNTKYCRAHTAGGDSMIEVRMGRKFDQPLEDAYRADFRYRVVAAGEGYLDIHLEAAQGPFSSRDYQIALEAIPLGSGQTFLHFRYTYTAGLAGRLAMQGYLATLGRDKVGFSVVGKEASGAPRYVDGTRGAAERNTMRYYLAIETYLDALSEPPATRMEKCFRDWFAATERYPRQLHEIERDAYLAMKRKEYARQQAGAAR